MRTFTGFDGVSCSVSVASTFDQNLFPNYRCDPSSNVAGSRIVLVDPRRSFRPNSSSVRASGRIGASRPSPCGVKSCYQWRCSVAAPCGRRLLLTESTAFLTVSTKSAAAVCVVIRARCPGSGRSESHSRGDFSRPSFDDASARYSADYIYSM